MLQHCIDFISCIKSQFIRNNTNSTFSFNQLAQYNEQYRIHEGEPQKEWRKSIDSEYSNQFNSISDNSEDGTGSNLAGDADSVTV
ncbi:MAG: hypothetical protein DGJ47_000560 [Rickettsiaceae bacterium]